MKETLILILSVSSKQKILTCLPLGHSATMVLCHTPCLQEEGARVEGSRGLRRSPRCSSSPWWWSTGVDRTKQDDPTTLPDSFSQHHRAATVAKKILTAVIVLFVDGDIVILLLSQQ